MAVLLGEGRTSTGSERPRQQDRSARSGQCLPGGLRSSPPSSAIGAGTVCSRRETPCGPKTEKRAFKVKVPPVPAPGSAMGARPGALASPPPSNVPSMTVGQTVMRSPAGPSPPPSAPPTPSPGHEVVGFLRDLGMPQYAGPLVSNGFDDLETLLCIEDADLRELGLSPCHLVKLRRKLQELQREEAGQCSEEVEDNPVAAFLRDANLGQYAPALLRSGFDELDVLCDMEDNDMKDLGIPRGHAVKLKRRLQEHKAGQLAPPEHVSRQTLPAQQPFGQARSWGALPDDAARRAVVRSWEQVQAQGVECVAQSWYRQLFVVSPEAIGLFPPELRLRYRDWLGPEMDLEGDVHESPALRKLFSKMLNAIGCTVAGLHDFGKLVPMLTQLGARHVAYGVSETHWPVLGRALSRTLRDCLGSDFGGEVETAWTMVYSFMSSIMIEGLRGAAAAKTASAAPISWMEPPLSKLPQSGLRDEDPPLSKLLQGCPWVEDCRSQALRPDLSNRVAPGTPSAVVLAMPGTRCRKLPRLWEDDDCQSEDSLPTSPLNWSKVSRQETPESYAEGRKGDAAVIEKERLPLVAG